MYITIKYVINTYENALTMLAQFSCFASKRQIELTKLDGTASQLLHVDYIQTCCVWLWYYCKTPPQWRYADICRCFNGNAMRSLFRILQCAVRATRDDTMSMYPNCQSYEMHHKWAINFHDNTQLSCTQWLVKINSHCCTCAASCALADKESGFSIDIVLQAGHDRMHSGNLKTSQANQTLSDLQSLKLHRKWFLWNRKWHGQTGSEIFITGNDFLGHSICF